MGNTEREYYSTVAFEMFQKHGSEEGLRRIQKSIEQSIFYGTIQDVEGYSVLPLGHGEGCCWKNSGFISND